MKIRETSQEDIVFMGGHSVGRGLFEKMPKQIEFSYTLEHEGTVLAVGGAILINSTTAWAWVVLSTYSGHYITTVYRVIRDWIDIFAKEKEIKRIQAYIECDFPEAIRTIEHLGFLRESTMPNFVDNRPAYLYVRIF